MMIKVKYIVFSLLFGMLFSFTVLAADGQLSFSDPTANVGDNISLNMKVRFPERISHFVMTVMSCSLFPVRIRMAVQVRFVFTGPVRREKTMP